MNIPALRDWVSSADYIVYTPSCSTHQLASILVFVSQAFPLRETTAHHEHDTREPVVAPSAPDAALDDGCRPAISRGPLHRAKDRCAGLGNDHLVRHCGGPADIQQIQETHAALVGRLHRDCCLGTDVLPLSSHTSRGILTTHRFADVVPHFHHSDDI